MKVKFCDIGQHEVTSLFWARTKSKPSACASCARKFGKPLKSNPKVKVVESWNNTAPEKPVNKKTEKTIPELIKLATIVFNRWIRNRDCACGYGTCISCGKVKTFEDLQCGHYMPSTYSELRFNEDNANAECEKCNCMDNRHLIGYRKNLIDKIGLERVEYLELHKISTYYKWEREELHDIINKYK